LANSSGSYLHLTGGLLYETNPCLSSWSSSSSLPDKFAGLSLLMLFDCKPEFFWGCQRKVGQLYSCNIGFQPCTCVGVVVYVWVSLAVYVWAKRQPANQRRAKSRAVPEAHLPRSMQRYFWLLEISLCAWVPKVEQWKGKRERGGNEGGKVASGNVKLVACSDLFARHRRSQRIWMNMSSHHWQSRVPADVVEKIAIWTLNPPYVPNNTHLTSNS